MAFMIALITQNPIKITQITDTHLYGTHSGTLLKMNTNQTLGHVLELVKANEDEIDLVLVTGDIAQDASDKAYTNFLEIIASLNSPFRWIPGNHDNATVMNRIAEGTQASEKTAQLNNWLIVLLDTSILGQVHGNLAKTEINFLTSVLRAAEKDGSIEHCLITMHHNPVPGNSAWMKDIGLENSEKFFEAIKISKKVRCVLYGHIHQELDFEHEGIRCLCTPSTCIQFKPNVTSFSLDRVNPGYRSLQLFADGRIESEVRRVSGETFEADYNSPGY
ncbi:MAG: 3',5'-cyclic-AMP phosphodiesterase [SAR86 cluster bacterium]|uniref:3',5'-cyclic-AMP phosphodiesterase n=1 Tax=SAR86 cluster bacterium TaxID=2030880 RepID=A0A2A4WY36_9GAMM|nr:MAG: 3',5'-cyclic-AMP phosphodiesterase [SAR86 cluster bacterium]